MAMEDKADSALKTCKDLWYKDGSVVLRAETTLFCVYSGLLSQYSPIFRSLFDVPQPLEQDQYEGHPLVHLQDSSKDLYHFLKALHDISFDIETAGDVTVVGGILRVSTKYEVRDLRSRAIHALRKSYPTSFIEYQSAVKGAHFTPKICPERRIYVVNLICETNTLILLPAALLFCCWSKTQDLLGGVMFNGEHIELPTQLAHTILLGREELTRRAYNQTYQTVFERVRGNAACLDPAGCQKAARARGEIAIMKGWLNPLENPTTVYTGTSFQFCGPCSDTHNRVFERHCQRIWDELPSVFKLPSWKALQQQTSTSDDPLEW